MSDRKAAAIPGRRLRRVAIVSLVLNGFLLAFAGAQVWRGRVGPMPTRPAVHLPVAGEEVAAGLVALLTEVLPKDDAAVLRQSFIAARPGLRKARESARDAIEQLRAEIARDPLDPAALQAAIERLQGARSTLGPVVKGMLMDAIPAMSPEGRRLLGTYRVPR